MQLKNLKFVYFILFLFLSNTYLISAEKKHSESETIRLRLCIEHATCCCSSYLLSCCNLCNICTSSCPKHEEVLVDFQKNHNAYSAIRAYLRDTYKYDFTKCFIKIKDQAYDCNICDHEIAETLNFKIKDLPSTVWIEFWIFFPIDD